MTQYLKLVDDNGSPVVSISDTVNSENEVVLTFMVPGEKWWHVRLSQNDLRTLIRKLEGYQK